PTAAGANRWKSTLLLGGGAGDECGLTQGTQTTQAVATALTEVVVEFGVDGEKFVVGRDASGIGVHGLGAGTTHGGRRRVDVWMEPRCHRRVDRRPDGTAVFGVGDAQGPVEYVRVHLKDEGVTDHAAADGELIDRDSGGGEGLDDGAGAERGGLQQRTIALLGYGGQGQPDHDPGQGMVDQDRAVA